MYLLLDSKFYSASCNAITDNALPIGVIMLPSFSLRSALRNNDAQSSISRSLELRSVIIAMSKSLGRDD